MSKTKQSYTIKQFYLDYLDDNACLDRIFKLRYGHMTCCPHCSKIGRFRRISTRKCHQCPNCYYQIYATAGTIFERTRTPLTHWFVAVYMFATSKNGLAAKELERFLGITYKTAFRMLHQIRSLMRKDDSVVNGIIEFDEAVFYNNNLTVEG